MANWHSSRYIFFPKLIAFIIVAVQCIRRSELIIVILIIQLERESREGVLVFGVLFKYSLSGRLFPPKPMQTTFGGIQIGQANGEWVFLLPPNCHPFCHPGLPSLRDLAN